MQYTYLYIFYINKLKPQKVILRKKKNENKKNDINVLKIG